MAHCDDEYAAYANAVIDEADAAVVTDEKFAELTACESEHTTSGGGSMGFAAWTGVGAVRSFPTALHGYAYTRLMAGDEKRTILKEILLIRRI